MKYLILMMAVVMSGCTLLGAERAPHTRDANAAVDEQANTSWTYMLQNISPRDPKVPGGPTPLKGVVVAAQHKKDPDYYFHWVRDSAHVMAVVAENYRDYNPAATRERDARLMADFVSFSRGLQKFDMGEPRFTVEGKVDTLKWSRPQYDGLALRALAVMKFLSRAPQYNDQFADVVKKDLEFVADLKDKRGFDIWEELYAENYHTRLVQLAALEKGAEWLSSHPSADARTAADKRLIAKVEKTSALLRKKLDEHWAESKGYLRSQVVVERTDGYTTKKTDLDSAVVVAVIDADRPGREHTVLDDRVQATVAVLEDLFRRDYPINKDAKGLAYGRYQGDSYYGGNPWFLVTSYYAQFYFRLANRLAAGEALNVTARNLTFVKDVSSAALTPGQILQSKTPEHTQFVADLRAKGNAILGTHMKYTPEDGQLYEQFSKVDGSPKSSRGIGWAHAAFLSAYFESRLP